MFKYNISPKPQNIFMASWAAGWRSWLLTTSSDNNDHYISQPPAFSYKLFVQQQFLCWKLNWIGDSDELLLTLLVSLYLLSWGAQCICRYFYLIIVLFLACLGTPKQVGRRWRLSPSEDAPWPWSALKALRLWAWNWFHCVAAVTDCSPTTLFTFLLCFLIIKHIRGSIKVGITSLRSLSSLIISINPASWKQIALISFCNVA